ncbi:WD repeat-containing protein WRAP73 [Ophiocordyceps camponoti-floridani]|uniref:WD repeat-containing protein WRAP73 n=1 Tax=Ophiocordyceps camponoti-floridani TaxID=2030778 RepID=A0A8H4VCL1_9HYPO|nr:WD repeat-containing protein WRAP73 [Ophiocordyceps camponoti-floridani]
MHSSPVFAASSLCKPSPDGRYIASLNSSTLSVRSVESLRLVRVTRLGPGDGPISNLLWAPSSARVLVSTGLHIHVFSAADESYHASAHLSSSPAGKPAAVFFGIRDTEVLVVSILNFSILDLTTSKIVEISNCKFHQATTANRGFSLRSETGHLALLSRTGGKDLVSLHHPVTRQVSRSWIPDTVDAQGLIWTPDGRWLLLWDSPAHGHRLSVYTADGQHFRTVDASGLSFGHCSPSDKMLELGIKTCQLSPNAEMCAIGDFSRVVTLLDTQSWRQMMQLIHPSTIVPSDTVQVWQEQMMAVGDQRPDQAFLRARLSVAPPEPSKQTSAGCSLAAFDTGSTLLATRLDDWPSTTWIWDVAAGRLRAVLMSHSHVGFSWHPVRPQLLLISCQDESFVWEPLSKGPIPVKAGAQLPTSGRRKVSWINRQADFPELVIADAENYVLASLSGTNPWQEDDDEPVDDTFFFKH